MDESNIGAPTSLPSTHQPATKVSEKVQNPPLLSSSNPLDSATPSIHYTTPSIHNATPSIYDGPLSNITGDQPEVICLDSDSDGDTPILKNNTLSVEPYESITIPDSPSPVETVDYGAQRKAATGCDKNVTSVTQSDNNLHRTVAKATTSCDNKQQSSAVKNLSSVLETAENNFCDSQSSANLKRQLSSSDKVSVSADASKAAADASSDRGLTSGKIRFQSLCDYESRLGQFIEVQWTRAWLRLPIITKVVVHENGIHVLTLYSSSRDTSTSDSSFPDISALGQLG